MCIRDRDYILVAGYISRGEDAEAAVKREVFEETGMTVDRLQFNKTSFFEPSNTLMVNFACMIEHPEDLKVNEEVDNFKWFTFDEARANIKKNSLAERLDVYKRQVLSLFLSLSVGGF